MYYQLYPNISQVDASHRNYLLLGNLSQLAVQYSGAPVGFSAVSVLAVTWYRVGYYPWMSGTLHENTFQAVLVTDFSTTHVLYGYNCGEMSWSYSDMSTVAYNYPFIGYLTSGVLLEEHSLSRRSNSHSIACIGE